MDENSRWEHEPLFHEKEALASFGSSKGDFLPIIEVFIKEKNRLILSFSEGMSAGNVVAIYRTAHRLKGTLGIFRAHRAVRLAQEIESQTADGSLPEASDLGSLIAMMNQLERELRHFKASLN